MLAAQPELHQEPRHAAVQRHVLEVAVRHHVQEALRADRRPARLHLDQDLRGLGAAARRCLAAHERRGERPLRQLLLLATAPAPQRVGRRQQQQQEHRSTQERGHRRRFGSRKSGGGHG